MCGAEGGERMTTQVEALTQAIAARGYRLTPARRAIVETLVAQGGHVSADDLAERVRQAAPSVGRMTVYRTLELLCELGVIRPIYQGTGAAHYILMHQGGHHHLICNGCGLVIEFDECTGAALGEQLSARFGFEIQTHLLEFHGLCAACRED